MIDVNKLRVSVAQFDSHSTERSQRPQRQKVFTEGFDDSTELAECPELSRTVNEGKTSILVRRFGGRKIFVLLASFCKNLCLCGLCDLSVL
jgi:hypothetical protein